MELTFLVEASIALCNYLVFVIFVTSAFQPFSTMGALDSSSFRGNIPNIGLISQTSSRSANIKTIFLISRFRSNTLHCTKKKEVLH